KNWTERSLYYACRNYTELVKGGNYRNAMPSIHIGLLDFTLFKEHVKFYAMYKLLEEKDHYPYTDKLQIGVVDLTRIDLATPEDQEYNIDKWARLFKAKTWEDIKMVAAKNRMIDDAATTIYQLTADERIRQQCEAREDYLRRQRGIQEMLEEQRQQLAEKDQQLTEKDQQLTEKDQQLTEQKQKLMKQEQQIAEQQKLIEELQKKCSKE
ncbi:MAG: PD-(D/E)XK nuclease family transposase, partial [Lachnospiraceae bacterium]|nr:PD-(D/E)XK nuclease family transposase [Lachnospiraceae bacterium]